jgi:D-lactate dehydrogenase
LTEETVRLATGFPVVCCFAHDKLNARVLGELKTGGTKLIALRSAGFNHVDLSAAAKLGLPIVRVPAYSPYSVAEHATALILSLNRKISKASARVHELNFSLEGLVGFDLHGKTVGVVGTGRIGSAFARIMAGFGCHVLAYDLNPNPELQDQNWIRYVPIDQLYRNSDIISLHIPLMPSTRHLVDAKALQKMKKGVMLINTGRGALIDTPALIDALKSSHVGFAGLDVYEEEENIFFQDLSDTVLQDDVLARLMTFPNVLITAHQAFLTREAIHNIVETTLDSIRDFEQGFALKNELKPQ